MFYTESLNCYRAEVTKYHLEELSYMTQIHQIVSFLLMIHVLVYMRYGNGFTKLTQAKKTVYRISRRCHCFVSYLHTQIWYSPPYPTFSLSRSLP